MSALQGWFKPNRRVDMGVDGEWITDGRIALKWMVDPSLTAVTAKDPLRPQITDATEPVSRSETVNGWAVFNGVGFAAHFVDLVEFAHPLASWRQNPGGRFAYDPIVAFVDGAPVAIVMPVRDFAQQEPNKGPPCPECNGDGFAEDCSTCDGEGDIACSLCGHEDDCEDCNAKGRVGECSACTGTGRWKAPE